MNRWSWLAVVTMTVALPALADHDRDREWERARGREFREQPAVIEKRRLQWMLTRIDARLSEVIGKAKKDKRTVDALKALRDDLNNVRDTLAGAQDVEMLPNGTVVLASAVQPLPPGPPQPQPYNQYPQQPYTQPAPPTGPGYQTAPPPPTGPGYQTAPPGYYQQPQQQPPPPGQPTFAPSVMPMNESNFRNLLAAMERESFGNDRLRVLGQAAPTSYFVVAQALEVFARFNFPQERLEAARILRPRLLDNNNFYQLYQAFEFPKDKDELKRILGQ